MFLKVSCTCISKGFLFILLANFFVFVVSQNDTIKDNGVTLPDRPPMEFPKNESTYPFKDNITILQVLASQTSNDSEVDDLRHGGQFNISHNEIFEQHEIPQNVSATVVLNPNSDPTWQSELIEDGSDTEETRDRRNDSAPIKTDRGRNSYGSRMPAVQGQLAAILAGVFIVLAVVGYAAMLSWRRFLESRYGNREMLVNEEDFYDPNDMRHFSL